MKNRHFLCTVFAILLCACTPNGGDPTPGPGPNPEPNKYTITYKDENGSILQTINDVLEGTMPLYTLDTPTKDDDEDYTYTFNGWIPEVVPATKDATYTATYKATEKDKTVDLGLKTIAEVRAICETLTNLNEAGIAVDMTRKVTIKALALSKKDLIKTAEPYNISSPCKIIFGDETGYIACASPDSKDGNTLYGKVGDYAGKTTKYYEVTGYISMYMKQPELYVPGKTYVMYDNVVNGETVVSYDVATYSSKNISLDGFYDEAVNTKYNMKGHGYGKFYTLESVKCVDRRDNVYMFTDGDSVMKVNKGLTSGFHVGKVYDIIGYISLEFWMPAFYAFSSKISAKSVDSLSKDDAIEITIADFKKYKSSQDDSFSDFSSYIKLFKNVYVSNVYATAIFVGGNYYVCVRDTYYSGKEYITGHETGQNQYGMIEIENNNYWNVTLDEIARYCPIAKYFNDEISFDFYYSPYYQTFSSNKPIWKVFAYNELILAE
ncbi:MAG: hypothetical protein HUJ59_02895 [Bacilli bacterium]|nr:hypothetical protein [Bacilli bacterium]